MPEVSADLNGTARKNAFTILQRLSSVGQSRVPESVGVSESTISRWKDGEIDRLGLTLAVLGLRVVPQDARVVDPAKLAVLMALAEDGLSTLKQSLGAE